MNWRLLIDEGESAALNMAVDEALLTCFDPSSTLPTLRLYSWQPAAVSIGYFQPAHSDVPPEYPIFRRITGGGAICHDGDLTYSVVVGKSDPITKPSLYNSIHEAMSNALRHLGVDARPRWAARREDSPVGWSDKTAGRSGPMPLPTGAVTTDDDAAMGTALAAVWQTAHASSPFYCSARHADADLVVGEQKILGSAQRRSRAAILQHGSVPLDDSACDARMTSVQRESQRDVKFDDVASAVCDSFSSLFGARFERGELSEDEQALAEDLADAKYGSAGWNYRR